MGYVSKKGEIVLFGVETTYGTISSSINRIVGEVTNFSAPTYNKKLSLDHQLSTTDPSSFKQGVQEYTGGKIEVVFRRGDIFEYVVGAATDSSVGSAYDHTLDTDDILSSISIAKGYYDSTGTIVTREVYLGSVITAIGVSCKKGENVTLSVSFDCASVTSDSTTISASYFSDDPILYKGSTLTITPSGSSATTVSTITNFSMNFKREVATAEVLNSFIVAHKDLGNWSSDVSFDYYFIDKDELDIFQGGSGSQDSEAIECALDFTVTNELTGADERTIKISSSSSKLGNFNFGDDGGFVTGKLVGILKSFQMVFTDDTANWDA